MRVGAARRKKDCGESDCPSCVRVVYEEFGRSIMSLDGLNNGHSLYKQLAEKQAERHNFELYWFA
jgi:hypothetical protein